MMNWIDSFLNRITMYRLVYWYLWTLVGAAAILAAFHILPYSPISILFSAFFLVVCGWAWSELFGRFIHRSAGVDSPYITVLILTLIFTPVAITDIQGIVFLAILSAIAIGSKFIFSFEKQHIFNPAAFAAVVSAFALGHYASWWVAGNVPLLAFVLIGGLLVVRKIQQYWLVGSFTVAALVTIIVTSLPQDAFTSIEKGLLHSSLIFLACIMLTEPQTTPPDKTMRILYGVLVGILFDPAIHVGSVYSTPELALVVGNVFSYIVSPKGRLTLTLVRSESLGGGSMQEFVFAPNRKISFLPGQYMEWTLPNIKKIDQRGNRRYFTIASSPTEKYIRAGIRFYEPASAFKRTLRELAPGSVITAGQLSGDFVLPKHPSKKLTFIAGGIGITPFRAMVKYVLDVGEKRDMVLLYGNRNESEVAYKDIFDHAERKVGMKTVYINRPITADDIVREIPDYTERMFYISGPRSMVVTFEKALKELGIHKSHIKTDFFPGFA